MGVGEEAGEGGGGGEEVGRGAQSPGSHVLSSSQSEMARVACPGTRTCALRSPERAAASASCWRRCGFFLRKSPSPNPRATWLRFGNSCCRVLLGCQLGARWCLASSLTCDFNMIKNYTHDWTSRRCLSRLLSRDSLIRLIPSFGARRTAHLALRLPLPLPPLLAARAAPAPRTAHGVRALH